jgi:hypothetical protein
MLFKFSLVAVLAAISRPKYQTPYFWFPNSSLVRIQGNVNRYQNAHKAH